MLHFVHLYHHTLIFLGLLAIAVAASAILLLLPCLLFLLYLLQLSNRHDDRPAVIPVGRHLPNRIHLHRLNGFVCVPCAVTPIPCHTKLFIQHIHLRRLGGIAHFPAQLRVIKFHPAANHNGLAVLLR